MHRQRAAGVDLALGLSGGIITVYDPKGRRLGYGELFGDSSLTNLTFFEPLPEEVPTENMLGLQRAVQPKKAPQLKTLRNRIRALLRSEGYKLTGAGSRDE